MNKRAVVLAGGKGTRLRPYTVVLPKPLMPLGEYPILEIVIRQLAHQGFDHITLAVNHQADLIKAFFGDGSRWQVRMDYSLEDRPLGTIGPLRLIHDLPANFLVMNGDVLTDLCFASFFEDHVRRGPVFSIASHKREHRIDYGVLQTGPDGYLKGFHEKPVNSYDVSMGIYMVGREILHYIPEKVVYGFDSLMLDLLRDRKPIRVQGFDGYWLDIGRPDDYAQAVDEFGSMKQRFLHD